MFSSRHWSELRILYGMFDFQLNGCFQLIFFFLWIIKVSLKGVYWRYTQRTELKKWSKEEQEWEPHPSTQSNKERKNNNLISTYDRSQSSKLRPLHSRQMLHFKQWMFSIDLFTYSYISVNEKKKKINCLTLMLLTNIVCQSNTSYFVSANIPSHYIVKKFCNWQI